MIARVAFTALLSTSLLGAALSAGCSDPGPSTGSGGVTGSGGATGSSGGDTSSGGAAADTTVPSDFSQAGIEAFLAAGTYKSAPWVMDAAPRDKDGLTSPHGRVRVFYNPAAVTSRNGGFNDPGDDPGNAVNSMSIKELYDTADTYLGAAVMLRVAETGNSTDWVYYCASTAGGCTNGTDNGPFYFHSAMNTCDTCHGGLFYGPLPP